MIKVPDGARKLLNSYIRVYEEKLKKEYDPKYREFYERVLEEFEDLKNDIYEQKSEIFQGDEIEVMKKFVISVEQYAEWINIDDKFKYFSEVIINPNDLQILLNLAQDKRRKKVKKIVDFIFSPKMVMGDGEIDGFKREIRVVTSINQISSRARMLPAKKNDTVKVYYECVGMQMSEVEWNEYLRIVSSDRDHIDLGEIYCRWHGLRDKAVYYVLINN